MLISIGQGGGVWGGGGHTSPYINWHSFKKLNFPKKLSALISQIVDVILLPSHHCLTQQWCPTFLTSHISGEPRRHFTAVNLNEPAQIFFNFF